MTGGLGERPTLCGITLYGFGSHEVDMMLWLTDSRPRVYAEGEQIHPVCRYYDDVSLQMRLANGCMAALQLSTNCAETVWDCLVIGDEGTLAVGSDWVSVNGERTAAPIGPAGGMTAQLAEFLAAINEGREPEASGRQVRDTTMAALEAARRSLASHAVEAVTLEWWSKEMPPGSCCRCWWRWGAGWRHGGRAAPHDPRGVSG